MMTYQDIVDTFAKYPSINVNLSNLTNPDELAKYDSCGINPEFMFSELIQAVVEEYIHKKFSIMDESYTFDKNPIEFITAIEFNKSLPSLTKEVINLFPNTDSLLEYINKNLS